MPYSILNNNTIYYAISFIISMLYNNIYQYAINGAIYSIKYVQIRHYIEHVNKQPILHNILCHLK